MAARTEQGDPLCQPCWMPREECTNCRRIRPVIARPADGPLCGTCWRRHPAATRPCDRCGVITRLHHFGLCAACARPEVVRNLLTTPEGHLHPAANGVLDVLCGNDNPAAVLKWLQSATARTLLITIAQHAKPLDHALMDRLRPAKAAAKLRALLVAHGALPARDEHLAMLEQWVGMATAAIADPIERRLVHRFAIWHHLRRLRQASSPQNPIGYGPITVVRGELSATIALLTWLRRRGTTIGAANQSDIDDWLTSGPAGRRGASAFVTWAVRRRHAIGINLPARTGTMRRQVLPHHDQRWQLTRTLLHDEDIHPVDRVAGLLVLLYAQPVTRIATLTLDRIHTDANGTHVRLGRSPIRLPPPLDSLVDKLVQRRSGHIAIGRSAPNSWLFPGAAPGRPLSAARLNARLQQHGIPVRLGRNTALIDLAAQLPAAVLSQLLGLHLQTATNWTVEAGNTRLRYAAAVAVQP
ncbi:hypothetical protein [Actinoplanes sp. NPDC049802]|uniref:hypothetical protein n=1 Tax=Actinoplanes sp. NPDC049802 TaxID=3154742 RepID=UPI0033F2EAF1